MDCLNWLHLLGRPYKNTNGLFEKLSQFTSSNEILDLGTGGGEHLEHIIEYLKKENSETPLKIIASDLYPDIGTYKEMKERIGEEYFDFISEPVNAIDVSSTSHNAFSVCTMFHHLEPEQCKLLLENVLEKNASILILELNERSLDQLIFMCSSFFMMTMAPFFARKKSLVKFLFGTLIPIVPAMVQFDAFVSILRAYKLKEILEFMPKNYVDQYELKYTKLKYLGVFKGSGILIYPKSL